MSLQGIGPGGPYCGRRSVGPCPWVSACCAASTWPRCTRTTCGSPTSRWRPPALLTFLPHSNYNRITYWKLWKNQMHWLWWRHSHLLIIYICVDALHLWLYLLSSFANINYWAVISCILILIIPDVCMCLLRDVLCLHITAFNNGPILLNTWDTLAVSCPWAESVYQCIHSWLKGSCLAVHISLFLKMTCEITSLTRAPLRLC